MNNHLSLGHQYGMNGNPEVEAQLRGLENIVEELSHPHITPQRKNEIEQALADFKDQPYSWNLATVFMSMSTNSMALFCSANVLEHTVQNNWTHLSQEERAHVKTFLIHFLESYFVELKHFVRNKVLKVFISIGQAEWRDFFPDFLDLIISWCSNDQLLPLGLTSLKMLSEECSLNRAASLSDAVISRVC